MKENWLDKDSMLWPCAYESSTLPQSLSAIWRVSIDLRYLKKTLRPHDLYSLKLELSK
jgi:hypothetical protein